VENWFQVFAFKYNLYCYAVVDNYEAASESSNAANVSSFLSSMMGGGASGGKQPNGDADADEGKPKSFGSMFKGAVKAVQMGLALSSGVEDTTAGGCTSMNAVVDP
jgi:hypothetical protein